MRVWRITSAALAAFDGEGPRRYGSRWTSRGIAVVYASATLSLAALERFVHTDPDLETARLVATAIDIEDGLAIQVVEHAQLPSNWRDYPAPEDLASVGDRWFRAAPTAVLSVPSAIIPHERNYVVNPSHSDARRVHAARPEPFSFDPRMWKRRPRS